MTKDKFTTNMYSLLTVAFIILIAGMMYVNIINTEFTYSDSPQVNPDLPPFAAYTTQKELFTGFAILIIGTGIMIPLFSFAKKQLPRRYDGRLLKVMETIYSLYIVALLSIFFGALILLTLLLLFETF